MNFRLAAACAASLSLFAVCAQTPATMQRPGIGRPPIMPLSQVKKGMMGTAWTVFQGTEPEPAPVEIIGILKNANGPKSSIILGKMGGKVARTNVAGGMSGSPVYIDGKLIGAVALRFGEFSADPICGITPIEDMLEINELDKSVPPQLASAEVTAEALGDAGIPVHQSLLMQPIGIPLVVGGATPGSLGFFQSLFKGSGMQMVQGGSMAALKSTSLAPDWKSSLRPGDTVSMILVSGDLNIASACTVTYNDGSRVLICGHPFLNLGPLNMPMAKGEIVWTLASSFQPTKISNAHEVVGTFTQDRHTGMLGHLGEKPRMIPVKLTMRSLNAQGVAFKTNVLNFEVMENQKFTPQLMTFGLFNAINGINEFSENTTYRISANVSLANGQKLDLQTMAAPSEVPIPAGLQSALWFGDKINKLFANAVRMPDVGRVEATIDLIPERRTAAIESAWIPSSEVEAGGEVPVKVFLRPYRGGRVEREIKLKVPAGLTPGNYRIQLSEAAALNTMQSMTPMANRFMELTQTISLLNQERANNRLYAVLLKPRPTVYADEKTMPNLPSSVLNVMQNGRSASRTLLAAPETSVAEQSIPFDYVVNGSYSLRLTVK